jgi:L-fucose mutarotase/ribose pyranase (RbsD/FucU family)
MTRLEQSEFYKQAKDAYAVVHTGETAPYGNIMLEKGLVLTEPKVPEKDKGSSYNREKV